MKRGALGRRELRRNMKWLNFPDGILAQDTSVKSGSLGGGGMVKEGRTQLTSVRQLGY